MIYITMVLLYIIFLCMVILFIYTGDFGDEHRSLQSMIDEIRVMLKYKGRMRLWAHIIKIIIFSPCIIIYYSLKYLKKLFIFLVYIK